MSFELILPFLRPIEPLLLDDSVSENEANSTSRQDVYTRITSQIVASLEQGVRPWVKPWNAEHAAGRITQPLSFNLQPYSGI